MDYTFYVLRNDEGFLIDLVGHHNFSNISGWPTAESAEDARRMLDEDYARWEVVKARIVFEDEDDEYLDFDEGDDPDYPN